MSSSGVSRLTRAGTVAAGVAKANGTPNLITVNVPNDGQTHSAMVSLRTVVTGIETGGAVGVNYTSGGAGRNTQVDAGGGAVGSVVSNLQPIAVDPGTTVTLQQTSPLTAGASTVFASLSVE